MWFVPDKKEIFDVFSMNGIDNYPAAGEIFLENVILKVSQTHFSKDFYPKTGHTFFKGGGGGCEVPWVAPPPSNKIYAYRNK